MTTIIIRKGKLKNQSWCHTSVIPATWEAEIGGSVFEASSGKKQHPISKMSSGMEGWWQILIIPAT
jgi:hypothetical protein